MPVVVPVTIGLRGIPVVVPVAIGLRGIPVVVPVTIGLSTSTSSYRFRGYQ